MKIEFIHTDDWTCLILDGKLVTENHSLSTPDVLNRLGINFKSTFFEEDEEGGNQEFYKYRDSFPRA